MFLLPEKESISILETEVPIRAKSMRNKQDICRFMKSRISSNQDNQDRGPCEGHNVYIRRLIEMGKIFFHSG